MGNFFGVRRRGPVITEQDRAILRLKLERDKIKTQQKKAELELERTQCLVLELLEKGMKERALVVLRRKKQIESLLNKTEDHLATLADLVAQIEYTQIAVGVTEGMKVGTEALKQLNSLMDIDDIQQMMEDNEEAAQKQKEISDMLQRTSEKYDEDELLNELNSYLPEPQKTTTEPSKEAEITEPKKVTESSKEAEITEPEKVTELVPTKETLTILDDLPNVPQQAPQVPAKEKHETRQLEPAT